MDDKPAPEFNHGQELAIRSFASRVQKMKSREEIEGYATKMAVIAIKLIGGLKGDQYKRDFLTAALQDPDVITLKELH